MPCFPHSKLKEIEGEEGAPFMGQRALPPGFRFSPTDEELVVHYLMPKTCGRSFHQGTIADVDIYKFEPWDLPEKSALPSKDQEWYFFSVQDKKYSQAARINRTTRKGYWKATGKDRKVYSGPRLIGLKKTLIYYEGRAPNGERTNWIMHEYRMDEDSEKKETLVCATVLCRIRRKGGFGPMNGEQYGAPIENGEKDDNLSAGNSTTSMDNGHKDVAAKKGHARAFNLCEQIDILKAQCQISPPKIRSRIEDTSKGTELGVECEQDVDVFFRSISETPHVASFHDVDAKTFIGCDQYIDMQNIFDLDTSLFPNLSDVDGNSIFPTFSEQEILGEMWELVNTGQGDVSNEKSSKRTYNQNTWFANESDLVDGDFIELEDLDGFTLISPTHSSKSNEVPTYGGTQDVLHSQGSAARRVRLQIPSMNARVMDVGVWNEPKVVYSLPKVMHGGYNDPSIPLARHNPASVGKTVEQIPSGFKSYEPAHGVSSSSTTRSYLSKHMSTYSVSTHEVVPAQLCYAALTDVQQGDEIGSNFSTLSSTALTIKDHSNTHSDTLAENSSISIFSPSSLTATSSSQDSDSEAFSDAADGGRKNSEIVVAHKRFSNRYCWKAALRDLIGKAKSSALASKLRLLEGGMRARFNDSVSALGKPAAELLQGEYINLYDTLRKVVTVALCHLAAAVLIFSCLFWGYGMLKTYASSVSV